MYRALLFPLLLLLTLAAPLQARSIAGIEMPDSLQLGDNALQLNGAGIRTKMFMDIYAGGLYLETKNSDADAIVAADAPMAIRLHMVSGLVTSEAMEEATREGFDNATRGKTEPIASEIEEFINVFKEPIAEGDIFDISYQPGKGLMVYKNGEFKRSVDGGLPFKQATFAIWLGDRPAHSGLRKGMLGR